MNRLNGLKWAFVALALACTKPPVSTNAFDLPMSADEAFSKISKVLQSDGVGLNSFDPTARSVSTHAKKLTPEELGRVATLVGDPYRFSDARVTYAVTVEDRDGKAHVQVNARIEGYFSAKGAGTQGSSSPIWEPEPSNGTLEKELITLIQ